MASTATLTMPTRALFVERLTWATDLESSSEELVPRWNRYGASAYACSTRVPSRTSASATRLLHQYLTRKPVMARSTSSIIDPMMSTPGRCSPSTGSWTVSPLDPPLVVSWVSTGNRSSSAKKSHRATATDRPIARRSEERSLSSNREGTS